MVTSQVSGGVCQPGSRVLVLCPGSIDKARSVIAAFFSRFDSTDYFGTNKFRKALFTNMF